MQQLSQNTCFRVTKFEAFYRFFLGLYLSTPDPSMVGAEVNYEDGISSLILQLLTKFASISDMEAVECFQHTCERRFDCILGNIYGGGGV